MKRDNNNSILHFGLESLSLNQSSHQMKIKSNIFISSFRVLIILLCHNIMKTLVFYDHNMRKHTHYFIGMQITLLVIGGLCPLFPFSVRLRVSLNLMWNCCKQSGKRMQEIKHWLPIKICKLNVCSSFLLYFPPLC